MSRVAMLFTGGTISMGVDPAAGGKVPTLDGAAILARAPGIEAIADLEVVDLGRTPASHFTFPKLFEIASEIRRCQADPAIGGVVVVQGTDVIEETAFLWDLVLDRPEPVVVVGAMRAPSDGDDDGPANLRAAVRCATSPELRGAGVNVVLDATINPADAVTKTHASALDSFQCLDTGPLGRVVDDRVMLERARGPRRHVAADRAADGIPIITAHVAMDGSLLDAAAALGPPGIVVEATGAGNTAAGLLEAAERAMGRGIVVAYTTRCPAGAAGTGYGFPGGGAQWRRAGALLAGHLSGPNPRIALAVGLGAGLGRDELAALLADPPGWGPVLEIGAAAARRRGSIALMPLDTLVTGRIATFSGDAGFGWVEAVGIRDGLIAFAGSAVDLETRADPHTRRIELEPGELAMPGIIDAHIHLVDTAFAVDHVDLSTAPTLEAAMDVVRAAAERVPAPAWLVGFGWDQRRWGVYPSADDLERVAPGRLVSIHSFDHHAILASHAALAAAGIDAATPDPAGGVIKRGDDGAPTGVLLENASALVVDRIPKPEPDDIRRALAVLGRRMLEAGIVGAHEPGSLAADPTNRILDLYAEMAAAGELPFRLRAGVQDDGLENALERGLRSGQGINGSDPARLAVGWLKLFADGTLGSRTAALLEPLEGGGGTGIFTTPPEELALLARRAADGGITTQIHAIGDAAVRAALDALAPVAAGAAYLPRLEHIQLCHPDDRRRFAELGVAASVQPVHLREDAATARRDWGDRAEVGGYAWKSLLDAGAVVAFGTDAPVVPIDPWPGIALAIVRHDPSWGEDVPAFGPDEALNLDQALRAATVGVATTARDRLGGRLVPGSPADLIVLPAAPRESGDGAERAAAWAEVRPRLVMVGGEVAFER